MAYIQTKSTGGLGTILHIDGGAGFVASPPTWVTIGEIKNLKKTGDMNETDDATNLSSAAREFIATIRNCGSWDLTVNGVPNDAGQVLLQSAFTQRVAARCQIVLPLEAGQTVAGDAFAFNAIVEKLMISNIEPSKIIPLEA